MQSNRIISIHKRAKRRILALALVATAFAGYGALSIFAQDDKTSQLPIEKMSKMPGVKAVGIRLINPNPKLTAATAPQAIPPGSAPASILPAVSLPTASLPTASLPTASLPTASLPTAPSPGAIQPAITSQPALSNAALPQSVDREWLPVPVTRNNSDVPTEVALPSTFANLSVPPRMSRMSDVQSARPEGKVVMKLNGGELAENTVSTVNTVSAEDPSVTTESVDIRVVQSRSMGQPARMPPFIFQQSGKKVEDGKEVAGSSAALVSLPGGIRMTIADGVESETSFKVRTPQLVKPKPIPLEHTVTLAQSTEIESRRVNDEQEVYLPKVEVDASMVPQAISGAVGYNKSKSNGPQAVVTDAVTDAFVALAPPAKDLQFESISNSNRGKSLAAESIVDRSRRKFDSRPVHQSPIATVDLECLAATTMDLPSKLVAIAVQDENVCKALHNDRTVSLVGNQAGTTLVQIWTADLGEKPQVVRVNVCLQGGKYQATSTEVKDINQVIAQSFPRANVHIVTKDDGSMEVAGTTESEESARRILELVRKLYLVPVKDKLTVSN